MVSVIVKELVDTAETVEVVDFQPDGKAAKEDFQMVLLVAVPSPMKSLDAWPNLGCMCSSKDHSQVSERCSKHVLVQRGILGMLHQMDKTA